jgi:LDH2 family malate/lactate/ureidoglycolate dehydrogenase
VSGAHDARELRAFAARLFAAAGMEGDKADTVAEILVDADLLGHTTHGLALAPRYLKELGEGAMTASGAPGVVTDRGACVVWDGHRLPGVWVTAAAVDLAVERAQRYGTVTVVVRNNHHIGCLAAYLPRATDRGYMVTISTSDPSQRTVAPWGGMTPVMTPNPIAVGIPTSGDPILVDVSASITTNNMVARVARDGGRLPGEWVLDARGAPTDDPKPALAGGGGSIMLAGGADHGQKGYGWALLVEALTQALPGFGRADSPTGWGSGTFVQVFDPDAFAGRDAFTRQTDVLVEACRASSPRPGFGRVRLPGENGLARRRAQLAAGVELYPGIGEELTAWAERLGVPPPALLSDGPSSG